MLGGAPGYPGFAPGNACVWLGFRIGWGDPYPYVYGWYVVFSMTCWGPIIWLGPMYVMILPCILAWRRHFLGGIVIVAISIEFIWYMLLGPVPYGDGEERLLVAWVLPLWGLSCAGGLLHLATWFMERLRKVGWCRT